MVGFDQKETTMPAAFGRDLNMEIWVYPEIQLFMVTSSSRKSIPMYLFALSCANGDHGGVYGDEVGVLL